MSLGSITSAAAKDADEVLVAVIDSGINTSHELFEGRISELSRSFVGTNQNNYEDQEGHGSHVAGIIAMGTSDNVKLLVLKIMQFGTASVYNMERAVKYAANCGADVANISAGLDAIYEENVSAYEVYMKAARDSGMLIFAASGNEGEDIDASVTYPAYSDYVEAVGAIDLYGELCAFSNYGEKQDFVAAGRAILSATVGSSTAYEYMYGTSMAAPHLAAAAAMVKTFRQNYTPDKIVQFLENICYDLGSVLCGIYPAAQLRGIL